MREREDRLVEVVGRRRRQCIFSSGAIGDVVGCGRVARMREASRGGSVGGGGLCSTRGGGAGHQAGGETGGENRRWGKPAARAAPLFQQRKEEDRGRGGFVIFQNLRDLTEK